MQLSTVILLLYFVPHGWFSRPFWGFELWHYCSWCIVGCTMCPLSPIFWKRARMFPLGARPQPHRPSCYCYSFFLLNSRPAMMCKAPPTNYIFPIKRICHPLACDLTFIWPFSSPLCSPRPPALLHRCPSSRPTHAFSVLRLSVHTRAPLLLSAYSRPPSISWSAGGDPLFSSRLAGLAR